MPLLDHFRPPLGSRLCGWSFLGSWATYISAGLNGWLPPGYFAAVNLRYRVEIETTSDPVLGWVSASPQSSSPITTAGGVVEVGIDHDRGGSPLAGAIGLVSPANKDRPAARDAFLSKCAAYLQAGVGLVVVDVVTEYTAADLHAELLARLGAAGLAGSPLYGAAYRPVEREKATMLDIWHEPLAVGGDLPTLPLWLRGGLCVPVELQATYDRTCREQRVSPAA